MTRELKLPRSVPLSSHHSVATVTFPLREPHLDPAVRHSHVPFCFIGSGHLPYESS